MKKTLISKVRYIKILQSKMNQEYLTEIYNIYIQQKINISKIRCLPF